jgi:hypothetical protein
MCSRRRHGRGAGQAGGRPHHHHVRAAACPPRTAARFIANTGVREIHFAALAPVPSGMRFRRPDVYMGGTLRPPEYDRLDTAGADVAAIINAARG